MSSQPKSIQKHHVVGESPPPLLPPYHPPPTQTHRCRCVARTTSCPPSPWLPIVHTLQSLRPTTRGRYVLPFASFYGIDPPPPSLTTPTPNPPQKADGSPKFPHTLYPEIEPNTHGKLAVGDGHEVYWEVSPYLDAP